VWSLPHPDIRGEVVTTPWSPDGGIHEIPLDTTPGRLWLCGKQVVGPHVEEVLERTGAHTVVCLVQPHELTARYPHYVQWLTTHQPHRALWYPIGDLSAPPLDDARRWVTELHSRVTRGDGVVMHCAAGRGRAGTMAVAVLLRLGMPLADALAHVRAHRPGAGPEAGSQLALVQHLAEHPGGATDIARSPH